MQDGADARITRQRFNNAAFRAYTNVTVHHKITLATVRVLCDDVKFCDGRGIVQAKSCINSM